MNSHIAPTLLSITKKFEEIRVSEEERARETKSRFNVFTMLLKADDEVRLHTRFLHNLLNPDGTHDCGTMFLDLFFETLENLPGYDHNGSRAEPSFPGAGSSWRVFKEAARSPYGQIDILLERPDWGIAIENKINAHDQEEQVASYAKYLQAAHHDRGLVLYLTLDGRPSPSAGYAGYVRISYERHILAWLEECHRATSTMPPIHQALTQYREVVKQLTGRTIDIEHMKPIIDIIRENPEIVNYRRAISAAVDEAIFWAWDNIRAGIRCRLEDRFGFAENWDDPRPRYEPAPRFGVPSRAALVLHPPQSSCLSAAPFEIWIERARDGFGIGPVPMGFLQTKQPLEAGLKERMGPLLAEVTDGWSTDRFPLGWRNLLDGLGDADLAPYVSNADCPDICRRVIEYVGKLEDAYGSVADLP